jgi:hypothetical protein
MRRAAEVTPTVWYLPQAPRKCRAARSVASPSAARAPAPQPQKRRALRVRQHASSPQPPNRAASVAYLHSFRARPHCRSRVAFLPPSVPAPPPGATTHTCKTARVAGRTSAPASARRASQPPAATAPTARSPRVTEISGACARPADRRHRCRSRAAGNDHRNELDARLTACATDDGVTAQLFVSCAHRELTRPRADDPADGQRSMTAVRSRRYLAPHPPSPTSGGMKLPANSNIACSCMLRPPTALNARRAERVGCCVHRRCRAAGGAAAAPRGVVWLAGWHNS